MRKLHASSYGKYNTIEIGKNFLEIKKINCKHNFFLGIK